MMVGEARGVRSESSFCWAGCNAVHVGHALVLDGVDIIDTRRLKLKIG